MKPTISLPQSKGIDDVLRDAPLPVKLMGGLMKPVIGAVSDMLADSQQDADELLAIAERALRSDPAVQDLIGTNAEIGDVFSSSSSNMNGAKSMQLQCQCTGSAGSGVVAVQGQSGADGGFKLTLLQLQANGRTISVESLASGGGSSPGSPGGYSTGTDVIDVEVLD